ncbi:hypothetical protein CEXT_127041 [Caerostris extrusa]|uniref:Uncharacterized protein n=1 Tax=Caerostris extrusa TaxID=172846 RepID=A0AAV4Y142_CAEEX|nr:hypothetical protein CEXT_127041 [Caerostris extrusa]
MLHDKKKNNFYIRPMPPNLRIKGVSKTIQPPSSTTPCTQDGQDKKLSAIILYLLKGSFTSDTFQETNCPKLRKQNCLLLIV